MFAILILASILISASISQEDEYESAVGNPLLFARPCNGTDDITISYEPGRSPELENSYTLFLTRKLGHSSNVGLKFSDSAEVTLITENLGRIRYDEYKKEFVMRTYADSENDNIVFEVKGTRTGVIPYPTSITINNKQYCRNPDIGILDGMLLGTKDTAITTDTRKKNLPKCGQKKIEFTELITNSAPTKPGELPWHAAIYKLDKHSGDIRYICGGTVVSKLIVVTAAHCASKNGASFNPHVLNVVLGKYNLAGGDLSAQERGVLEIVIHPQFNAKTLVHDIAMLKLDSDIEYTNYIQPACLWDNEIPSDRIGTLGTVGGWGFNQNDALSEKLGMAKIPIVPTAQCLRSHMFFSKVLTDFTFCAGYRNGTSPCNGDSGGGLLFPVTYPSSKGNQEFWHLRGIVSISVKRSDAQLCDPSEYVLYTDVAKYVSWIQKYIS